MNSESVMCVIRKTTWTKALVLVTALHLFNASIDPADSTPWYSSEDLSINEIESVAELLLEEIAGIENFFEEHNDSDSDSSRHVAPSFVYILAPELILSLNLSPVDNRCFYQVNDFQLYTASLSKNTPPPKLA